MGVNGLSCAHAPCTTAQSRARTVKIFLVRIVVAVVMICFVVELFFSGVIVTYNLTFCKPVCYGVTISVTSDDKGFWMHAVVIPDGGKKLPKRVIINRSILVIEPCLYPITLVVTRHICRHS